MSVTRFGAIMFCTGALCWFLFTGLIPGIQSIPVYKSAIPLLVFASGACAITGFFLFMAGIMLSF